MRLFNELLVLMTAMTVLVMAIQVGLSAAYGRPLEVDFTWGPTICECPETPVADERLPELAPDTAFAF